MATTATIYRLCVDGDMENTIAAIPPIVVYDFCGSRRPTYITIQMTLR